MTHARLFLTWLLLVVFTLNVQSQEYSFKGSIKDEHELPVIAATATLLLATDSTWVQSVLTDEQGAFIFEKIKVGKYLLDVQALGYANKKMPVNIDADASLAIVLEKKAGALQEVTVTANKPFIENAPGKIIVNVGSTIMGTGSTVLDLLRKSPGVTIDEQGNISIQGKQGITVMIEERPTYLSGPQLVDYLRSLPSDDVAQLELITQPSSRFDAEGSGGIINIKQKKSKKEGFNGIATVTPGQGVYPNFRSNLNLTYKNNRLNLYMNGSYHKATGFLRSVYERNLLDNDEMVTTVTGRVFMKEVFSDCLIRTGADYNLTDKTTAGVLLSGNYHPNTQLDETIDLINDKVNGEACYSHALHERGFVRKRAMANAYLKHNIDDKHNIVTNADYTHSFSKSRQYLNANYGRRIERPRYNTLNPFIEYISQYHYEVGNPNLLPEISHQLEFTHVYNSMLTTRVFGSHTADVINGVLHTSDIPNTIYNMGENIAVKNTTGISATMYKKLLSWWEVTVMGYVYSTYYSDSRTNISRYGNGYGINADSQFVFNNGWSAECHLNFMGRRQAGIYARAEPAMYNSCGVSKKVMKDSGTIRLNIEDPFLVYKYDWSLQSDDILATGTIQHNTMYVGMSFVYNFGKQTDARQRNQVMDEARRM